MIRHKNYNQPLVFTTREIYVKTHLVFKGVDEERNSLDFVLMIMIVFHLVYKFVCLCVSNFVTNFCSMIDDKIQRIIKVVSLNAKR